MQFIRSDHPPPPHHEGPAHTRADYQMHIAKPVQAKELITLVAILTGRIMG